jgi:nucleotide-binding universal stress UspA family protein
MFTLVLLGIAGDGTAAVRKILHVGAAVAARHGAGFAVLHVSPPLNREGGCVLQLPDEAELCRRRDGVEALCREVMPVGLTADVLLESGFLHVELPKTARIMAPDLVVIGGLDEAERCRLELKDSGDDAALLVSLGSDCPVLVVPAVAEAFTGHFRRILAVTDLSFSAAPLMTLAARVAQADNAELRAFHPLPLAALSDTADLTRQLGRAEERLAGLCRNPRQPMTWSVREGDPAQEVLKDAREFKADLIVLAADTHRSGTGPAPSVVSRILTGARCPVLLAGPLALAAGKRHVAATGEVQR